MKVLFLDVDGVLHSLYGATQFNERQMRYLKYIVDSTGCEICMSSAWRLKAFTYRIVNTKLVEYGMNRVIGKTKDFGWQKTRTDEILHYVDNKPEITSWCAIDDMNLLLPKGYPPTLKMKSHFVMTKSNIGLTKERADMVIQILMANDIDDTLKKIPLRPDGQLSGETSMEDVKRAIMGAVEESSKIEKISQSIITPFANKPDMPYLQPKSSSNSNSNSNSDSSCSVITAANTAAGNTAAGNNTATDISSASVSASISSMTSATTVPSRTKKINNNNNNNNNIDNKIIENTRVKTPLFSNSSKQQQQQQQQQIVIKKQTNIRKQQINKIPAIKNESGTYVIISKKPKYKSTKNLVVGFNKDTLVDPKSVPGYLRTTALSRNPYRNLTKQEEK